VCFFCRNFTPRCVIFGPSCSCPAISCLVISCLAISCSENWSVIFTTCYFTPCNLVHQFHAVQFWWSVIFTSSIFSQPIYNTVAVFPTHLVAALVISAGHWRHMVVEWRQAWSLLTSFESQLERTDPAAASGLTSPLSVCVNQYKQPRWHSFTKQFQNHFQSITRPGNQGRLLIVVYVLLLTTMTLAIFMWQIYHLDRSLSVQCNPWRWTEYKVTTCPVSSVQRLWTNCDVI